MGNWTLDLFWQPFAGGATIGQEGSEEGTITRDEAHAGGARITMERDCRVFIPYAITCSVYGWLAHTRYFATEEEAEQAFTEMKPALENILRLLPSAEGPEDEVKTVLLLGELRHFVETYPAK